MTTKTTARTETVLLAVTGESPAVVTETVFGLHFSRNINVDRVVVITTSRGADQARLQLVVGDEGKRSPLSQLCHDYGLPPIRFSEADIRIVPGENGLPVDDARSEGDQRALADFITQTVRELTEQPNVRVIGSLAGGRKTMTFFLGYAMSLFGRRDDMLTHVLVSEPFEQVRGFYYPTPTPMKLQHRFTSEYVDAAKARVNLIQIPFVRMREEMPKSLVQHQRSYTETVDKLNQYYDPSQRSVVVDSRQMTLMLEGKQINLSPTEFGLYAMFARDALENPLEDRGFQAPKPGGKEAGPALLYAYLRELLPVEQRDESDGLDVAALMNKVEEHFQSLRIRQGRGGEKAVPTFRDNLSDKMIKLKRLDNFADLKRRVIEAIDNALDERIGKRYHPHQELDEEKQTRKKNTPFRLELDARCIEFID
ncbi:MAG: TIGR02584 family CRISPR-associated protein [Hahellaceae bacterium]|nr:TIGR02584 family CRISPR-associated protein [Hahellaceae bacterium]